jgi:hypothetical protein
MKKGKSKDRSQAMRYLRNIDKLREAVTLLISIQEVTGKNLDLS